MSPGAFDAAPGASNAPGVGVRRALLAVVLGVTVLELGATSATAQRVLSVDVNAPQGGDYIEKDVAARGF